MFPKTEPKKRVLFLDGCCPWSLQPPARAKHNLETTEVPLVDKDPYVRSPSVCRSIALLANNGTYDLIVLGNYCGTGLGVVRAMNERARQRTVIVYHPPVLLQQDTYEDLGITMFCDRTALADAIPELFRHLDAN